MYRLPIFVDSNTPDMVILVVFVLDIMVWTLVNLCLASSVVDLSVVTMMTVALRRLLRNIGTLSCRRNLLLTLKYWGVETLLRPTLLNVGVTCMTALTTLLALPALR